MDTPLELTAVPTRINSNKELTTPLPPPAPRQPSVGEMLAAFLQTGVNKDNVAAVEQMVKLYEHVQAREAEKEFAVAFAKLQAEMPEIQVTRPVYCKDGSLKYRYAPLEDLMRPLRPILEKHGFTVSWRQGECNAERLTEICVIQHVGGHKREHPFTVRIGSGPPGCTTSQADGSAGQYGRRYSLCDALGIVVENVDTDARAEGGAISKEQAEELARRVAELNVDRTKFLKYAGANSFAEIPAAKYATLDDMLTKKEKGRK